VTADRNPELAQIAALLNDLKRLAILQLVASGVQAAHIAQALDIHPSAISRMMPVREIQQQASRREPNA